MPRIARRSAPPASPSRTASPRCRRSSSSGSRGSKGRPTPRSGSPRSARRSADLRPTSRRASSCSAVRSGGATRTRRATILVDGLQRAAAAAREEGVPLGFEPIHPAQSDSAAFICSVADALAVLEEAGLSRRRAHGRQLQPRGRGTGRNHRVARPCHGAPPRRPPNPDHRPGRARPTGRGPRRCRSVRRRLPRRGVGRHPRRRDLLDTGRVLVACPRTRPRAGRSPRCRGFR